MDRVFTYAGAIPQDTDILNTNKNVLYGLGYLVQAALGTGTSVVGLVGAQSAVPDLHITIGPGAIYSSQTVDASAYGDLGTDANTVMKQGILKAAQTLTLTPPGTSGYSQVYLVEATYSDTDGGATVLPYYNSSNPSAPYAGPANAGTSNFTARQGLCTIALKAGTAAPTGSQTTPSTDAGYLPLYTITLVNGQTAITNAQIIQVAASFVPYNLNNLPTYFVATVPLANRVFSTSSSTYGSVSNNTLSSYALATASANFGAQSGAAFTFTQAGVYSVTSQMSLTVNYTGTSNVSFVSAIEQNSAVIASNQVGNWGTSPESASIGVSTTITVSIGDTITLYGSVANSAFTSGGINSATISIVKIV